MKYILILVLFLPLSTWAQFDYYSQGDVAAPKPSPGKNSGKKLKRKLTKSEKRHQKLMKALHQYTQKYDKHELRRLAKYKKLNDASSNEYKIRVKPQKGATDKFAKKAKSNKRIRNKTNKFGGHIDYKAIVKDLQKMQKETRQYDGDVNLIGLKKRIDQSRKRAQNQNGNMDYKLIKKRIAENRKKAFQRLGEVDYRTLKKIVKKDSKQTQKYTGNVDLGSIKKTAKKNSKQTQKYAGDIDYKSITKTLEQNRKDAHKYTGELRYKRLKNIQKNYDKQFDKFGNTVVEKPYGLHLRHKITKSVDVEFNLRYKRYFLLVNNKLDPTKKRNGVHPKKLDVNFFGVKQPNYKLILKPSKTQIVKPKYDKKESKIWEKQTTR